MDCQRQRLLAEVNGQRGEARPLMCPCRTVERLILRTGPVRTHPTPEDNVKNVCPPDLPQAGERAKEAVYSVHSLDVD